MPFAVSNVLAGPVWWAVFVVYLIVIATAVFVRVDSLRDIRHARFTEMPEPRIIYTGWETLYLIAVVGVWLPFVPREWSTIPVLMTPISLVVGTAYLLRVVFPKPPKVAPAVQASKGDESAAS
jgi:hypothetical protein